MTTTHATLTRRATQSNPRPKHLSLNVTSKSGFGGEERSVLQSGGEEQVVDSRAPRRNRVTLPALPSKLQSTLDLSQLQLNEVSKLSTMRGGDDETPL